MDPNDRTEFAMVRADPHPPHGTLAHGAAQGTDPAVGRTADPAGAVRARSWRACCAVTTGQGAARSKETFVAGPQLGTASVRITLI